MPLLARIKGIAGNESTCQGTAAFIVERSLGAAGPQIVGENESHLLRRDGELISATFSMESGRTLAIVLRIQNNTYTIEQWKVTTEWTDDGTGENLWLG